MKTFLMENPVLSTIVIGGTIIIFYLIFFRNNKKGFKISDTESPDPQNLVPLNFPIHARSNVPRPGSQVGRPAAPSGGRMSGAGVKH